MKTFLEAHGILPEGTLLDEALKVVSLYSDRIQQVLSEFADLARHIDILVLILD